MQEYTLFKPSAVGQAVDIPAFGGRLDVSWDPDSQVTQWGGLAYFVSYLKTSGLFDRLVEDAPFHYTSPNAPEVRDVVGTTVLAIVCGFTRYVHINRLRNDTVLAALLGLGRIVCEDSVRRALKSADGRELDAWLARHEKDVFERLVAHQYVLDIDNTVKPIFGHQEGAELGYNPQKPGRPSHNFHSYFIGSIRISLGVDVQPGKRHSGTCGMPRLWEIVDGLPAERKPRLLRGDVGYGGDENMCEAERRGIMYLFKIRRTKTVLSLFGKMENDRDWIDVGAGWEAKESVIMLGGWNRTRRCILLRRRSKDVRRIAMATQPRRRGRPKKNALTLVQTEFDFVEDKVGRCWDCCALVTNDENLMWPRLRRSTEIVEIARTTSTSTRTSTAGADSSRRISNRAVRSQGSSPSWPIGGTYSADWRMATGTWSRRHRARCTWALSDGLSPAGGNASCV